MLSLDDILQSRERIRPYIVKTPLIRLAMLDDYLGCEVYVKAECMQTIGAFKLRGAMNKALSLSREELSRGLVAASSGNHGRGVAYAAKLLGTKATIIMPYTATQLKKDAVRALGADIVECDNAERFQVAARVCEELGATMVPPFNDEAVMAGQGTIGCEVLEQCPEIDRLVLPVAGGGLIGGVSAAVKALAPTVRVCGAEPDARPRYAKSLAAGHPVTVENGTTVADALAALTPGELCFPVVQKNVDEVVPVSDAYTLSAMKLLLTEGKILAEPSSCVPLGAVLQGALDVKRGEKVCFVLSGGNVALEQLDVLRGVALPPLKA